MRRAARGLIKPICDCFEARFSPRVRTIEFNEFFMTVDDVSLDDHEVNVASQVRIAAGPRSEQDDPLRAGCRHEPFDGGLDPYRQ